MTPVKEGAIRVEDRAGTARERGEAVELTVTLDAGQSFHQRVTFLMIAVGMAAEQNLDVGELEPQFATDR